ncbi:hypothetical protein [Klebsiella pneumoniae]|uniref:hypothetical protein n=1 Tax=Klebsiella pneumoniae TaxID=573 RepID=UPI002169E457|nr:hypothetical protein [Klebsiella pneumoniae]MCS4445198.1 hypothetical protein [Klebsiella pneumoniae]
MTNNQLTDKRLAQLAKRNFCQTKGEEYTPFGDEVVSMAAELQQRRAADKNCFMYGIVDPDGKAHMDDFCVSNDIGLLEVEVSELNRNEGTDGYRVVALYTALPLTDSERAELQERRKADSEPVAWTDEEELNFVNDMACMWTKGMGINEVPLYRHAQPAPVVSEDLYKLANHIASSKNGLPDEWQDWAEELESDIRRAAVPQKTVPKSAFLQHAERLATDAKELAERVQRNDVKALTTSEEHRQLRDLVMMVKMLCRTVRKYNPESQQAANFTAYLQKEGLISAADCLRDSDPLDTESEDRRG